MTQVMTADPTTADPTVAADAPPVAPKKAPRKKAAPADPPAPAPAAPLALQVSMVTSQLKKALGFVEGAIPGKTSLPVLSNVLLRAEQGEVVLTGTNLEVALETRILGRITVPGALTVPAKLFGDLVAKLPGEEIALALDPRTQTVKIESGRFVGNLKGIDADEYPLIPRPDGLLLKLPAKQLRALLDAVITSAADNDTRPVLAGVRLQVRQQAAISLAAADGFRLAIAAGTLAEPASADAEYIIPARPLAELVAILKDKANADAEVEIYGGPNQIGFAVGKTRLVSRLIDGKFPDVERVVPGQYDRRIIANRAELMSAVKLAALIATSSSNVVKLSMAPDPTSAAAPGTLTFSANAAEIGDQEFSIDTLHSGERGEIGLNVKYLLEALEAITTEQVAIETQSPAAAAVLLPVGQSDRQVHVIMPMQIKTRQ